MSTSMQDASSRSDSLPSRKIVRAWLEEPADRNASHATRLVAIDAAAFAIVFAAGVAVESVAAKIVLGLIQGLVIARLFVLGHDACHQTLLRSRRANRILGRLLFLPSMTPYSMWEVGHNVLHHGYTNLASLDFNWRPFSPEEYAALPRWRRSLERVYRSGWAPGLYYLVEIWWLRLFFPSRRHMPTRRIEFHLDGCLAAAGGLAWAGMAAGMALATGQSMILLLATTVVLPFLAWNTVIGFLVFLHHVHPSVTWYDDKATWTRAVTSVTGTVHCSFGPTLDRFFHHIMDHAAHHVDMGIPLERLPRAQATLQARLPRHALAERFTWRRYFAIARECQLFDRRRARWLSFGDVKRAVDTEGVLP